MSSDKGTKINEWGQASVPAQKIISFADSLFLKTAIRNKFLLKQARRPAPTHFLDSQNLLTSNSRFPTSSFSF